MIGILTGDIINSEKFTEDKWLVPLQSFLKTVGDSPADWAIYRGDEFQIKIDEPSQAFLRALEIKATMKKIKNLDVRISIGIGKADVMRENILESNGPVFLRSGRGLDDLKKSKVTMAINTGNELMDTELNLYLKLALFGIMDSWTVASAEMVSIILQNDSVPQEDISKKTGIAQSAISQRLKRANLEVLLELNKMFVKKIKTLE
ncbi:MAG: transcriptional regulator [Saprospiraceae bacterium]|mgnify:CR=1 FL=1|nr:transcriptional regulator [Saprospiraceae bacterium]